MSQDYWDKAHKEKYSQSDWSNKPTMFSEFCLPNFPSKGKILDIGTGQGQDAIFFHEAGYEVVAIDYSADAISNAKTKNSAIDFRQIDISEGLPFKDSEFDVVYSHLALHYFDAKTTEKIFKEIHRILKPQGVFATLANTVEDPEIENSKATKLEENYYEFDYKIKKRFFSVPYMKSLTEELFSPIIIDGQGETYKDEIKTLIRFIGVKI